MPPCARFEIGKYVAQVYNERDDARCYVDLDDEVLDVNALALVLFSSRAINVQVGLGAGVTRQNQQVAIVIESVIVMQFVVARAPGVYHLPMALIWANLVVETLMIMLPSPGNSRRCCGSR